MSLLEDLTNHFFRRGSLVASELDKLYTIFVIKDRCIDTCANESLFTPKPILGACVIRDASTVPTHRRALFALITRMSRTSIRRLFSNPTTYVPTAIYF